MVSIPKFCRAMADINRRAAEVVSEQTDPRALDRLRESLNTALQAIDAKQERPTKSGHRADH